MNKTHSTLLILALVAWLIGLWLGPASGWALFALGLLVMVLISGHQLQQINRWVRNVHQPPPASVGPWDHILAPIYRQLKQNRLQIHHLKSQVDAIIMAAEALPDGTITLDQNFRIQWCNQTASNHLGLNLATDRNHPIFNIVRHPEFIQYVQSKKWDEPLLLQNHQPGLRRSLLIHISQYGIGQYIIVSRDITQLERLERARKDFVANVSHELRTPLTVLYGFIETLHETPLSELNQEQRQEYLRLMMVQAEHMRALVSDLLTLSSLESTPGDGHEPLAAAPIIHQAIKQGQALSQGAHHFQIDLDDDLSIMGAETELSSAFSNLINNAVRYTPKGGKINISWKRTAKGEALFAVQDSGIGIAEEDIPRLTERFYRVDRARSRATGGTGLGLAIAKHVAARHQAQLQIQSQLNRGSTFSLLFPAHSVAQATQTAYPSSSID